MLKNIFKAFRGNSYIYEPYTGLWTYYGSSEYIREQTEKYGFKLVEIIGRGFRRIKKIIKGNKGQEKAYRYISPWLNYVFRKE